jgi:molybdenum cofactor cytidylyltransferase
MTGSHCAAIILAGGLSSRMKRLKPLLSLGKSTIIDHVISSFLSTGMEVMVVVGYQGEEIKAGIRHKKVMVVSNPDYEKGMFTSVQAGVRQLKPGNKAFFIHPADIPLVKKTTIEAMAKAYTNNPGKIIYPVFRRKRGHPVLIAGGIAPDITKNQEENNLKDILVEHEKLAIEIQVDDEFILFDVDTPEDYQQLLEYTRHY